MPERLPQRDSSGSEGWDGQKFAWEGDLDDLECTHCGGEGFCWDGSDPLGDCPDDIHNCHACNGSGKRKDQVIF